MPDAVQDAVPIISEALEPTAAYLIGRLWARCEAAKSDEYKMENACMSLWMGMRGLEKIAVAAKTATHFSVALSNHMIRVSNYIEREIGVNPMQQWKW